MSNKKMKDIMKTWNTFVNENKKKKSKPLSENKVASIKAKMEAFNDQIARLEAAKEKIDTEISAKKLDKQKIEKAQDSIRLKKRAMKSKLNIDGISENDWIGEDGIIATNGIDGDELPLGEDVEACGKPGNPNHSPSDGKFSSYENRGSQSRHYSCKNDRESKQGSKKSKCGRDRPNKCKDKD